MKGRSADEIEEVQAEKEAKTRAILLEMVSIIFYLPFWCYFCFCMCVCLLYYVSKDVCCLS